MSAPTTSTPATITETGAADLPTDYGVFRATTYLSAADGQEHLALSMGDVAAHGRDAAGVLVRLHSECLTGDILASRKCDCGQQLDQALELIAAEGHGVLVYLRGHEGRGIGLGHKLRAYALQQQGRDTVDANLELGLPEDSRDYGAGAAVLGALGAHRVRLISGNPVKERSLRGYGIEVVRRVVPPAAVTPENARYLRTKRERMGHTVVAATLAG